MKFVQHRGFLIAAGSIAASAVTSSDWNGKGLWDQLDRLRTGPPRKGVVPIEPVLQANIKFFGRRGGFIRDGVLLGLR